jgi:hypothetical protein
MQNFKIRLWWVAVCWNLDITVLQRFAVLCTQKYTQLFCVFQTEENSNVLAWSPSRTTAAAEHSHAVMHLSQSAGEEESPAKKNTSPLHSFTSLMDRISPDRTVGDVYQRGVSEVKFLLLLIVFEATCS